MIKKYSILVAIFLFFLCASLNTFAQTWDWGVGSVNAAGTYTESAFIGLDSAGNIYEAGSLSSSGVYSCMAVFGSDTVYTTFLGQVIVVSADSTGAYRWAISAGGQASLPLSITTDPAGNLYLYGIYLYGSMTFGGQSLISPSGEPMYFLAKINSSGGVLWLKNIATAVIATSGVFNALCGAMVMDKKDNLYMTGPYVDTSITIGSATLYNHDPSGTTTDVFVTKFDSSGAPVWAKNIGGNNSDIGMLIAVSKTGDIYLGGTFYSDTLTMVDTLTNPTANVVPYFYIAKYDSVGNPVWAKEAISGPTSIDIAGASAHNLMFGMATDNWDNVYFSCYVYDTLSLGGTVLYNNTVPFLAVLAAYGPTGNLKFAEAMNGPSPDTLYTQAYGVAADNCGNIWATGGCTQISTYDGMFLSEYDTTGALLYTTSVPAGGDDQNGIVLDNKGHFWLGGDYLYSPFYVGPDTLNIAGGTNSESLFILKFSYSNDTCIPPVPASLPEMSVASCISLFPNPTTTELSIIMSPGAYTSFTVTNNVGQQMIRQQLTSTQTTVNVATLPPGLYYITFRGDNGTNVQKFVKM